MGLQLRNLHIAPTQRNAVLVASAAAVVYAYYICTELILNSDFDKLRVGLNKNELFDVSAHEKVPVTTLWLLSLLPLFAALFVSHFFLRHGRPTAGAAALAGEGGAAPHPIVVILSETRARIGLFVAAFFISGVFALRLFSAFAMVCNYPQNEMNDLCSLSTDVIDAIRARHGPDSAWIIQGTLIGALRANKEHNSLILNDHDYDVCYDKRLEPEILETVRSLGVTYERLSRTYGYVDIHFRVYPSKFSLLAGHSGPLLLELQACEPVKTRLITGCNGLPVPIPTNYEELLVGEYGENWRIPRSDNHALLCKLFPGW